jgi:hypothetical protein
MSAPERGGQPAGHRGRPAPVEFSEAEKIMAQWEALHDIAAAGRRPTAAGVAQYLAHTRCVDACSAPEHRQTEAAARRARKPAPPDPHPHLTDMFAWLVPPAPRRDEPPAGRDTRHS